MSRRTIDLNDAFPESINGHPRGPLPKQQLFLESALSEGTPKYIRYVGGIGSGKTLIGCITMLSLALLYPGTYLIAREFMPELKDTTLKTFLDVIHAVGKEVMVEHRVADNIVRIRSRGGVSDVLFRGLEEPDKLRSLNLNAFYIDEAAQVSEAAFLLLQGRLRGRYVRKGILTQNSGGHDWTYRYFVKKDMFKNEEVKKEFLSIKAPSTENKHLPEGYVETILSTWSDERIRREIYADEDAFEGQVYADFRGSTHVIQPFKIPDEWTRVVGADHGFRNPAAWIWGAVDYDGNIYIYREFYRKEWLIEEICKGKTYPGGKTEPGVLGLMYDPAKKAHEKIQEIRIDPSTRARRGTNGKSDWDAYVENLPEGMPLLPANNEKTAGIDRVRSYLKVNPNTGKPRLFVFNTCPNLIEEIAKYRYEETPSHLQGKKNEKEDPRKVDDHACFVAGTPVWTSRGLIPIEQVAVGDAVYTRQGFKPVLVAACMGLKPVERYLFSNGQSIVATPDHPVYLRNGAKVALANLQRSNDCATLTLWQKLYLTASSFVRSAATTGPMAPIACAALSPFTARSGRPYGGLSPQGTTSTTSMETQTTTAFQTLNASLPPHIWLSTPETTSSHQNEPLISKPSGLSPLSGIALPPGEHGTGNTACVPPAPTSQRETWKRYVWSAGQRFAATVLRLIAPASATRIVRRQPAGVALVYNLAVDGPSEYYVGDLLVSNCDALRYLVMSRPETEKAEDDIWNTLKYASLEGALYRDLQHLKKPAPKDPFGSGF